MSAWLQPRAALGTTVMVALLLLLAPEVGQACSKCLSGRSDEIKLAYILTTVFLSVLPPVGVGVAVWWLVRRARALEDAKALPATSPPTSSS